MIGGMEVTTAQREAARRAVKILGGLVKTAEALNLPAKHQAVQGWIANRVPAEYCPLIEKATREKGEPVSCEELRPDIAWSVLREGRRATDQVG